MTDAPDPFVPAPRQRSRRDDRGVALLVVLVVLFVVTVLMVDLKLTAVTALQTARNTSSDYLMDVALEGRMKIAVAQLRFDANANDTDSRNDRWAREEFFDPQAAERDDLERDRERQRDERRERREDGDDDFDEDTGEPDSAGSTDDVVIQSRPTPTYAAPITDEESKFNLNLLMYDPEGLDQGTAAEVRNESRERFVVLLDRYREGLSLDLSRAEAEDLMDRVIAYLERRPPSEGETGVMPVAKAGAVRILSPDELRIVEGFEIRGRGWGPDLILYDARDPEEVQRALEDPEDAPPIEIQPGLIRFLTVWSGGTGDQDSRSQAMQDSWRRINLNTASKPVLETLFWRDPDDYRLAEAIIEYRDQTSEGETAEDQDDEVAEDAEDLANYQIFTSVSELAEKVEDIDPEDVERHRIDDTIATVRSNTFSLHFFAEFQTPDSEAGEGPAKQMRWIVRRTAEGGLITLLREQRDDPWYKDEPGVEEDEER